MVAQVARVAVPSAVEVAVVATSALTRAKKPTQESYSPRQFVVTRLCAGPSAPAEASLQRDGALRAVPERLSDLSGGRRLQ